MHVPSDPLDLDRMMTVLDPPRHHYALEYGLLGAGVALTAMNATVPVERMASGRISAPPGTRKKPMTPERLARKRKNLAQKAARRITRAHQ